MNFHPDVFYVARKIWINRNLSREQHRALRDDMSDIGPRESSQTVDVTDYLAVPA